MRFNMAMLERMHGDHGVLTKTRHGWTGRQHCLQSSVGPTALLSEHCGGTCRLCTSAPKQATALQNSQKRRLSMLMQTYTIATS